MHRSPKCLGNPRIALGAAGLCLIGQAFMPPAIAAEPATPIEHLVVIFQENVSFDHYFATYPVALNPAGEPPFAAAAGTPSTNGLGTLVSGQPSGVLLTDNPNANNPGNGTNAINPFRLDRSQASTCDQDHSYGDEQKAFDQGLMDMFPGSVGAGGSSFCNASFAYGKGKGLVMGYFDGNTVTALMELRTEFRDERQFLWHDLRAVDAWAVEPGRRQHLPGHPERSLDQGRAEQCRPRDAGRRSRPHRRYLLGWHDGPARQSDRG
jgi:hypothetical protein